MQYSDLNIESMKLCDLTTGKEFMSIDYPCLSQEEFCINEKPKYFCDGSATFEVADNYINKDLFNKIFGLDAKSSGYKVQFDRILYKKQIRNHNKKRINKKWAKRYGYRDVIGTYEADVEFGEFNTRSSEVNCEFTDMRLIKIDGKVLKCK